jgi:eukaryotic-like serine/threonine-protein kinase
MNYGRYQIVKELGKGSMGVVYQAYDPQIDRSVAIKVLRQDRLTSEAFIQRFLREAKAIGRLSHPNIVTVYDVGEDQGTVYIAMEFLDGEPLHKIMEGKRFGLQEILHLGIQVAETLDYAHQKGIIHRDVKPGNIILQSSGQIKITDFGIAHIEDTSASMQTQSGEILGTPAYMSPEQVVGQPIDGQSDLFSLGIILYELSSGKRPFGGENLTAIFHSITQTDPPEPAKINPDIPQNLSQIILKCLRKTPDKRFETGKALAAALESCLKEDDLTQVTFGPPVKKKRGVLFASAILLVCLMGIGGLTYSFFFPKPPPAKVNTSPASLRIESTPPGAQVFINGTFKGKTPLQVSLAKGKHEVRLTLADYYDWEAQVQAEEKSETPLLVRLIPISDKKP